MMKRASICWTPLAPLLPGNFPACLSAQRGGGELLAEREKAKGGQPSPTCPASAANKRGGALPSHTKAANRLTQLQGATAAIPITDVVGRASKCARTR